MIGILLSALAWASAQAVATEDERLARQFRELLEARLSAEESKIVNYFSQLRRKLAQQADELALTPPALRAVARTTPVVRETILLHRDGSIAHPQRDAPMSQSEQDLLREIRPTILDRDLIRKAFPSADQTVEDGWYVWYFGRGVHLLYWRAMSDHEVLVMALSRARWMADLVSALPHSESVANGQRGATAAGRWQLVDAEQHIVYQWGDARDAAQARPDAEIPLSEPLSSWRLRYFADASQRPSRTSWPRWVGLVTLASSLVGLAWIIGREVDRDLREARQRVNFVNQVSHELKTPLTNIRLYADLLESDLDAWQTTYPQAELQRPRNRLRVITDEAQRLSRLIANVLTLARSDRQQLRPRWQPTIPDQVIATVSERFAPAMFAAGIDMETHLHAPQPIWCDPDLLEQILGNLLANVERHGATGQWLAMSSRQTPHETTVEVSDRGPGISSFQHDRIFEPFQRGATPLDDTRGTGIGLSISRRLARLLQGDLRLVPAERGATFQLTLPGPLTQPPDDLPEDVAP